MDSCDCAVGQILLVLRDYPKPANRARRVCSQLRNQMFKPDETFLDSWRGVPSGGDLGEMGHPMTTRYKYRAGQT